VAARVRAARAAWEPAVQVTAVSASAVWVKVARVSVVVRAEARAAARAVGRVLEPVVSAVSVSAAPMV
jgi:hypothetical protein